MVVVALGAAALAAWATSMVVTSDWWVSQGNRFDRVVLAVGVLAIWLSPACGIVLWVWRPANRAGVALVTLGVAWAWWLGMGFAGGRAPVSFRLSALFAAVAFRPLLFWLVLAWP